MVKSIVKEIIAFCNTTGGTIILGYDDNGKVVGLKNSRNIEYIRNKEKYKKIDEQIQDDETKNHCTISKKLKIKKRTTQT